MADVSSAFATSPTNPNIIPEAQPQPQQSPAPGNFSDADLQALLAQAQAASPEQQPAGQPAPEPQPQPQPQTTPIQTAPELPAQPEQQPGWQQVAALQGQAQQLTQTNAALQQRVAEQEATIKNLLQAQQEYDVLKSQQPLTFEGLETIDEKDAQKISAGIMKAFQAQLAPIQQMLAQQQQAMQQTNQWQEQRFAQERARDTLNKIIAVHPDFMSLQNDPRYRSFVQQREGKSSLTRDAIAGQEFVQGNTEYIIDMVNQFKQSLPQSTALTSVAPVQTASGPAQVQPSQPKKLPTIGEANQLLQMRRIDVDQFKTLLKLIYAEQQKQQAAQ